MQVKIQPSLRIGTILFLFLFTSEEACAETIRSVELIIQPRNEVQRSTNVSLICQPEVIHNTGSQHNYKYILYKDYLLLNTVQTNATNHIYFIPDSRVSHSGKYKCAVVIEGQKWESSVEDLTVKGLLTPVLTVDKQTLTEGDAVTAICAAEGETGSLTFFFKNGPKELYRQSTKNHKVEYNQTFEKCEPMNMFCYYSINLGDTVDISDDSNVISIHIQELMIKSEIEVKPSTDVIEGDLLTFNCIVDKTQKKNSELKISLLHEHTMLSKNMTQKDHIMIAKANDSGKYECYSKLGSVSKSSSVNITIKELFSIPVLSIPSEEVFEGEHFTISCQISSFASERIQSKNITYLIFRDKTLVIRNNSYSDTAGKVTNGKYMCKAEAKEIIKESLAVVFRAKVLVSKPEISLDGPVIMDKPFWISCHSKNGSLPITYSLKRNNITLNRTTVSYPDKKAKFLALLSTPSDISYLCEAENNGQVSIKMSETLHVTVIVPVGKPLLTVLPVPENIEEGHDVTLICGISKGSPPINFTFYDSNHTPINTTTVQSNSSSFVLSTVNREKNGNYYCKASNIAGMLSKSVTVTIKVSLAKWKKVLIAAFSMLLVTLLILFVVMRYKAKRGKREMAAKLSVKPASPKSDDSLTLSLTHDTLYNAPTVGVNNKESVWSERPPDVADQDSLESQNEGDVEYTEVVHPQPVDPTRIPLRKGTDTVYSELQTSQGAPEHINHQTLIEYAELNHDLPDPVD